MILGFVRALTRWLRNPAPPSPAPPDAEEERVQGLPISFGIDVVPASLPGALGDLRVCFELTRLEILVPDLELSRRERMTAAQTLCGAVIHMSSLTCLSLPESIVTEGVLLHLSLLPRLEAITISPSPPTNKLSGEVSHGFPSIRTLEIPNEKFLNWFASYPVLDLETLKAMGLGGKALHMIARKFPNLRRISIGGTSFDSQELLVMGACFQLEAIEIGVKYPLEMDGVDMDRFRAMFPKLHTLSITIRDH